MHRRNRQHRHRKERQVEIRLNLEPGWDQIKVHGRQMVLYSQVSVLSRGGLYLVYPTGWNGSTDTVKPHMALMKILALVVLAGKEGLDIRLLLHHLDHQV